MRVAGRRTLVTSDYNVSLRYSDQLWNVLLDPIQKKKFLNRVFTKNGSNYTSRMAEDSGLENIGMLNQGIIWNNREVLGFSYQMTLI